MPYKFHFLLKSKKIKIVAIVFIFTITAVNSQSKKGEITLTFSGVPLITSTQGSKGLSGFAVKGAIGFFFNDKFSFNLSINHTKNSNITIAGINSSYNSYSLVPVLRYSFLNKKELRFFLEGGLGFGTIRYRANKKEQHFFKHEQFSGGIAIMNAGIGVDYFFNNNFGVQLILPYIYVENNTSNYVNTIYYGLAPTIGIVFNLN